MTVRRYHTSLVVLHWLLALLILGELVLGYWFLKPTPNSDPLKVDVLEWHMAGGMLIASLMIVRLIIRIRTSHLPDLNSESRILQRIAKVSHYGFYMLVILMAGTGLSTAVLSGLNLIVFGRSGDPLPLDLAAYPTRVAHSYLAVALLIILTLHIVAVIYHQYLRKDSVLRRMGFG